MLCDNSCSCDKQCKLIKLWEILFCSIVHCVYYVCAVHICTVKILGCACVFVQDINCAVLWMRAWLHVYVKLHVWTWIVVDDWYLLSEFMIILNSVLSSEEGRSFYLLIVVQYRVLEFDVLVCQHHRML